MTPKRPLWQAVFAGWTLISLVLIVASWRFIHNFYFLDPDDALRLMEVRDLLAGQSWWDVHQYRLAGGDLHWSRLVDLPIAAVILTARPLLGQSSAELLAMILVPLVTLLVVLGLAAAITLRVADRQRAILAVLVVGLSAATLQQLRPLRIDHHGWQIALAMAALYCLLGAARLRNGVVMGLCLAALMTVSLEGLPIAAVLCGLAVLAWAFDSARRAMAVGLLWSFAAGLLLLQLLTRGWDYAAPMCDAVTADWAAIAATAAAAVSVATLAGGQSLPIRLAALAAAGLATLAVALRLVPECLGGPFAQLDPLTRQLWYMNVAEGMPIWRQTAPWAIMSVSAPVVGVVGTALALRAAAGSARTRWLLLLGALLPAFVLALLVSRAGATANAFAVPGIAWLLWLLLGRARRIPQTLPRALATVAALLMASPGLFAAPFLQPAKPQPDKEGFAAPTCNSPRDHRALAALPPSRLFAPLDISPDLIASTRHDAIASSHHRNHIAMHDVIAAYTGSPDAARAILRRYRARYLVMCRGTGEGKVYANFAPQGLWARLERGERFDWLEPVPIRGSPVLVWRVRS